MTSIPSLQEPPLKTHAIMCGWYSISAKAWYYGVNPDLDGELARALSRRQLALSALTNNSTYFLNIKQTVLDPSKGTLFLWAPTPLNREELQDIFQATKTAASWLGIKILTTKTHETYTTELQNNGFAVKSKREPYLIKDLSS